MPKLSQSNDINDRAEKLRAVAQEALAFSVEMRLVAEERVSRAAALREDLRRREQHLYTAAKVCS